MKILLLSFFIFYFAFCIDLYSAAYFNGSFETSTTVRRDNEFYEWKFDTPWHKLALRFFTNPIAGTEAFFKFYAQSTWERDGLTYLKFGIDEGHIRVKLGERIGIDLIGFHRQLRFLLGNPLLSIVNNDADKWDHKNIAGVTFEPYFNFDPNYGIYGKVFFSREYNTKVDAYGLRLRQEFLQRMFVLGFTGTYKKWEGGVDNCNIVGACDIQFSHKDLWVIFEIAKSHTPHDVNLIGKDIGYKLEFRNRFKSIEYGNLKIVSHFRDISENFRAYLSKDYDQHRRFDQLGFYIQAEYQFPKKAIVFTYTIDNFWRKSKNEQVIDQKFEVFVELILGFKLRAWYQNYRDMDKDIIKITDNQGNEREVFEKDNIWQHFFAEFLVENPYAKIRTQFKIKNMWTFYLRYIYGAEFTLNITENLKCLTRAILVDELYRTRRSLWSQLQYNFGPNLDFYLEYGNSGDSDNDLINDDDFVESSRDIEHRIHLYIRANF